MEEGSMEDAWLTWAKRLQSIASTGLHFSKDRYDRERYEEIGHIANEMLGRLGSVPIERIESLISDFAKGYATPKVDVRGSVFHDNGILLVREASDGYPPDARDFYKLLFLCEPRGKVSPQPGRDVMEVGFFGLQDLPPLSMSRTIADNVTPAFASRSESTGLARFD
jgi:hydrolase of X-linked nucleoside diphosphate